MATAEAKRTTGRRHSTTRRDESRRRRPGRLLMLSAGLLAALVWLAPLVVAKTALLERITNRLLADLNGSIRIGSASLGWFSPVRLNGLELHDDSGNVVVDIRSIVSEKSLLSLIVSPSELGTFRALGPTVTLEVDGNGTNLERLLGDLVPAADSNVEPPSGTANQLSAELIIAGGTIDVQDLQDGRRWLIEQLEATLALDGGPLPRARLTLTGSLGDSELGQVRLELDAPLSAEPAESALAEPLDGQEAGQLRLDARHFPLALVGACLRRIAPDLELDGRLNAQVACQWAGATEAAASARLEVNVAVENLFVAGSWLGTDRLKLAQVQTACRAVRQGGKLNFEKAELVCDLGHAAFQGTIPLDGDWRSALLQETYDLRGELDLARLAETLPSTVRIRDDTQITAGRIHFTLSRAAEVDHFAMRGRINADELSALHAGRPVRWPEPFTAEIAARDVGQQLIIDRLQCASSFLQLEGSGTSENFSARISFDLDQLTARLGEFIDLGSLRLAGTGRGGLTIRSTAAESVALDGRLDIERFLLTTEGRPPWQDDQLTALVHLSARTDGKTWQSLDSAEIELVGGPDRFTARLSRPMLESKAARPWPLEVRLVGELARWHARLAPWFAGLDDWQLRGQCELAATADYSTEAIDIAGCKLRIDNFHARGGGLFIDEPALEVRGAARLSQSDSSLRARQLVFESQTLSAASEDLVLDWSQPGLPAGRGTVAWRGDLNRLHSWLCDPSAARDYEVHGQLQGELQLATGEDRDLVQLDAVIQRMAVAWADNKSWQEPQVRLVAHAVYDRDRESLVLRQFELTSAGLACSATGQLTDLTSQRLLELDGQLQYDLARLQSLLQAIAGEGIHIAGRGRQPFSIRGPLVPSSSSEAADEITTGNAERPPASMLARLEVRAAVDWQSADIYGFRIGPGQLTTELARGVLGIAPLDLLVSEGRFQVAPLVRFEPGPAELQLGATKLFQDVRITPAMSQHALKYIMPVLAGVSHAEGRLSIEMDGARVPLASPQQADLSGRLTVHAIEISPGPLVQQFAVLFGPPRAIQLREQSVVAFRMVDGRVYHQGLELVWPNVTIRTYGSVGLDGTLALMAEMPVPEKWIGNNPLGDSLRDRIIRLPIGGTLQQPRLDQQALQRVSAEILRNAGINTLRGELNRQLDRLLGPPRQ